MRRRCNVVVVIVTKMLMVAVTIDVRKCHGAVCTVRNKSEG